MDAVDLEKAKKTGCANILRDYNVKLPFNTIEEVRQFASDMFKNTLDDPRNPGGKRNRRGELVSWLFYLFVMNFVRWREQAPGKCFLTQY